MGTQTGRPEATGSAGKAAGSPFAPAPPGITAPGLALPKAGGAIRGIGEKFTANPATGTASISVPIATSPGRSGFGPQLTLTYDSGRGNGPFGLGWSLNLPAVTRRTDRGLPRYDESDVFLLSETEDLVAALAFTGSGWAAVTEVDPPHAPGYRIERYRPRVEGAFHRIERWVRLDGGDTHWQTVTRDNVKSWYGLDANSRVADPADPGRVFSWLLCRSEDGRGNAIEYGYLAENGDGVDLGLAHEAHRTPQGRSSNRYLKRVRYGNRVSRLASGVADSPDWMFEAVLDYGDHDELLPTPAATKPLPCRSDAFSSYRSGFEVRTYRLCERVLMFHHFPDEEGVGRDCLVRSTDLGYLRGDLAHLTSVTQRGYRRTAQGYLARSLPPLEFGYTSSALRAQVREVDPASVDNLPAGLGGQGCQWADLDGDGLSGVLVTGRDAWFYKANLGDGRFGPIQPVPGAPPPSMENPARPRLLDLAGDGRLDVVTFEGPTPGFAQRTEDRGWKPWRAFESLPTVDFGDPNTRMADLNGDGHADLLVMEPDSLVWYPSLAEAGFGSGIRLRTAPDASTGPRLVFADGTGCLYLADMTADGLPDLVSIRNGSVSYWPNLGYGRFGPRVTMDGAPWFGSQELFDQRNVRLIDVDGSGATDIVYLGPEAITVYLNRCGNAWAEPVQLTGVPPCDTSVNVDAVDLLGTGTACLVWSSAHARDAGRPMRYADLMGGVKPHLLQSVTNNLGAQTQVSYAPSTRFFLADRAAGRPWLTRLPFPVQVVERVQTCDLISGNRFVTRYAYHHGYFDGVDREFRGFGMTEQWDTEVYLEPASNVDSASRVPPVLTKTWFHTGAFVDLGQRLSQGYAAEYWREPGVQAGPLLPDMRLPDTVLLADGSRMSHRPTTEELREAYRALKGTTLRQEVYALDATAEQERPYRVTETSVAVELLQPMAGRQHAVCLVRPQETINCAYERRLFDVEGSGGTAAVADPRVSHAFTLEVDAFGNVLRAVSLAYGRRYPDADLDPRLPSWAAESVAAVQARTYATVTVNGFTNAIDEPSAYRVPLPAESRSYELAGVDTTGLIGLDEARALCDAAGPEPRLIDHSRFLYRRDDLAGALPLGRVEPLGLPHENYQLAFTPELIAAVFGDLLPDTAAVLRDEGGYLPGDEHAAAGLFPPDDPAGQWWARSGRLLCSPGSADTAAAELAHALTHFFLPGRFADAFGNVSTVEYDAHDLLITQLRDPLGNLTTAGQRDAEDRMTLGGNDYRVLAPWLLSDANRNRSAVAFDTLGLVAATALMGKPEEQLGDSLAGLDPDPPETAIAAYLADPSADPHSLLGQATSRLVYDLSRFQTAGTGAPVVAMMLRETHAADLAPGQQTAVQHRLAYSDGFGREIQRKSRAEAGRWVGSGWTIFNNKGKPVRQYEPYFSATHEFEPAAIEGVSPVLCYDPLGRGVATLGADHTWTKIRFDPWRQETWDANDTILFDPAADPVAGDHARRLPSGDYLPGWHAARATGAMGPHEQSAAAAAAAHAATPSVAYLDSLGRTVVAVAHNRSGESGDTFVVTLNVLDIEGNQRSVIDTDGRTVVHSDYDLLGRTIRSVSMDAGERWSLSDAAGQPIRVWDSREHRLRTAYDALRRPSEVYVQTGSAAEKMVGRTVYGESQLEAAALNMRGKPYQTFDGAGVATLANYDFKGNAGTTSRRLAVGYRSAPDWASAVALQAQVFSSRTTFDALNRPATITTPDGSTIRLAYNEGSLLDAVEVNLRGEGVWTPFVSGIDYDAKGQRTRVAYGNGTITFYEYDPLTFRLARMRTESGNRLHQDLSYVYDPVGNVTHIGDAAQQTLYFRNTVVEPASDYRYDAIYQLIEATGREHVGQLNTAPEAFDSGRLGLEHPSDAAAMARYLERYDYDPAGNLVRMRHLGSDAAHPGWTRTFTYTPADNRLSATRAGAGPVETYGYDAHGSMTSLPHLSLIRWNHLDRLEASARQVVNGGTPETTYYVYDSAGERVRKVTESQAGPDETPAIAHERIYLGGFEIYREYLATGSASLERETLHVMDGRHRLAMVETRTAGDDGSAPRLIRYQLANHLGSAGLELDGAGAVISYEEFYPFGSTSFQAVSSSIRAAGKRYRYTGKERDDETGLSHHGARYYVPWLGRWLSADPLGVGGGLNVYRFADNNPMRLVDPSGMAPIETDPTDVRGHHYVPKEVYKGKGLPQTVYDFFAGATSGYNNDWHNRQGGHPAYNEAVEDLFQKFQAANGPWTVDKAREFLELVMTQSPDSTIGSFIDELHVNMDLERGPRIGNTWVSAKSQPGAKAVVEIAEDAKLMERALGGVGVPRVKTFDTRKGLIEGLSGYKDKKPELFERVAKEVMDDFRAAQRRRTPSLGPKFGGTVKAFAADTAPLEIGVAVSDYVFADEIERKKTILRTGHIRDLSAENQKFMYEQFGLYPVVQENGLIENWKWDLSTMAGFSDWAKGWIRLFGGNLEDPFAAATPYDPNRA